MNLTIDIHWNSWEISLFFGNSQSITEFIFTIGWLKLFLAPKQISSHIYYSTVCGGTFTKMSGVIKSPRYPKKYPEDVMCQWVIKLSPQYKIRLEFMYLQVEKSTSCQYDFVLVMDGLPTSPTTLGRFCGNSSKPVVDSTSSEMTVFFKSDMSVTDKGFEAYWYAHPVLGTKSPSTEVNVIGKYDLFLQIF